MADDDSKKEEGAPSAEPPKEDRATKSEATPAPTAEAAGPTSDSPTQPATEEADPEAPRGEAAMAGIEMVDTAYGDVAGRGPSDGVRITPEGGVTFGYDEGGVPSYVIGYWAVFLFWGLIYVIYLVLPAL